MKAIFSLKTLIVIVVVLLSIAIIFVLSSDDFKARAYMNKLSSISNSKITAFNAELSKYNYAEGENARPFETILESSSKYGYIIEILRQAKELEPLESGQRIYRESDCYYAIFINLETKKELNQIELRLNPYNHTIYVPKTNSYYKPNSNVQQLFKKIFGNLIK